MPTNITTEILGDHPPLDLIATDLALSATWIRGGEGLIGFGEWKSTSLKGKNRFTEARKWWHEQLTSLKIQNNVHGSGTGPILFSSFAYDSSEESKLVIPKIIIGFLSLYYFIYNYSALMIVVGIFLFVFEFTSYVRRVLELSDIFALC